MDDKKIEITGVSNRYQINKLKKVPPIPKIRKGIAETGLLPDLFFQQEFQKQIMKIAKIYLMVII